MRCFIILNVYEIESYLRINRRILERRRRDTPIYDHMYRRSVISVLINPVSHFFLGLVGHYDAQLRTLNALLHSLRYRRPSYISTHTINSFTIFDATYEMHGPIHRDRSTQRHAQSPTTNDDLDTRSIALKRTPVRPRPLASQERAPGLRSSRPCPSWSCIH